MSFGTLANIIKTTASLTSSRPSLISRSSVFSGKGQIQFQPRRTFALPQLIQTEIPGLDENIKNNEQDWNRLSGWIKKTHPMLSKDDIENLYKVFPEVVKDLTTLEVNAEFDTTNERTKKTLEHVVPWFPIVAVEFLVANQFYVEKRRCQCTAPVDEEEHIREANIIAWAMQIVSDYMNMTDDIVYGRKTRNSLRCWHTFPEMEHHSINDAFLFLENALVLLGKHFKGRDFYTDLLSYVPDAVMHAQCADNQIDTVTLALPTLDKAELNYKEELMHGKKQRFASIFPNLPITAAMMLNGFYDKELVEEAKKIGYDIGFYMTLVDDMAEFYGDEKLIEKYTIEDITKGRNSWLVWKALELGSKEDGQTLIDCYGMKDDASVGKVMKIYKKLNVRKAMKEMTEEMASDLETKILKLPQDLPRSIYTNLLHNYRGFTRGQLVV